VKTLKDLLRPQEAPVSGEEKTIHIETVRFATPVRAGAEKLTALKGSIRNQGLRHPIAVWTDGTLISGRRRLRAHFELANQVDSGEKYRHIRAIFVDNIEDAAKRMLIDNGDEDHAIPMLPSEMCRWWDLMRELDAPAAAARLHKARQQGVRLRKQTQDGSRQPGRSRTRGKGEEYLLTVLAEPFGMSEATASRLYALHKVVMSEQSTDERREAARKALAAIDKGETSIWSGYAAMLASSPRRAAPGVRTAVAETPAPVSKQQAAWNRSLPQLEGLIAGLAELGPPNPSLTWDQVGPVHARLMRIRRDVEKIINKMKETAQS
jgi:hypothetical protein